MNQLVGKLREKGLMGVIEAILWRIEASHGRARRRLEAFRLLRQINYQAEFLHEGGAKIVLPSASSVRVLLGLDRSVFTSADFARSAASEALLRQIIYRLYLGGQINPEKSIVDVGCWCADNALVWARGLCGDAVVYAIDPSSQNLAYGQDTARVNGIENVVWVEAACSDTSGDALGLTGSIEHATFHASPKSFSTQMTSKTLDDIVGPDNFTSIGFMHVDVEGFEERVLRGAACIIEASHPVITFEQHLCEDGIEMIVSFLTARGYAIYMVNEVLTDCRLDCRNFIAFPSGFAVPPDLTRYTDNDDMTDFIPAVMGPNLLEVFPNTSLGQRVSTGHLKAGKT